MADQLLGKLRLIPPLLVLAALAAAAPFLSQYHLSLLIFLFIYSVLAISYDIVGGQMGYMNLGHAIFYGIGAYVFAIILKAIPIDAVPVHVLLPLVFLVSGLIVGFVGFILSFPLFRLRGFYFAVATLGLISLVNLVISSSELAPITGGFTGISLPVSISELSTPLNSYYIALALLVFSSILYHRIANSRLGRALAGIREDEEVADVSGINVTRYKQAALVISAVLAGYAGAAYMWFQTHTSPRFVFSLDLAFLPVTMALLGGSGTLIGPIIGAVIFSLVYQLLIINIPLFSKLIIGAVLITVGIAAPGGIVGVAKAVARVRSYRPK